ncbi:Protein ARABIDILLO 1 [Vitis vinifera]|uniref:Protein ARABIDILLO 1 n=1 Tax=Vitis vinifera TaxID=29760 RepID=A0A438HJ54_VITVI|nr:Protein ARABIDILLO 1 [Vitis vinifera]
MFSSNRQEAAGALWNLSFDDRNREAIAAAGGVEALGITLPQCPISKRIGYILPPSLVNFGMIPFNQLLLHNPVQMHLQVFKRGLLVLFGIVGIRSNRCNVIVVLIKASKMFSYVKDADMQILDFYSDFCCCYLCISFCSFISIAIGREGGVAPLIALARSDAEDVHETAAGALWNLAFNPGNALRIVEEGGVPALVHLCASSVSKMARFMAALALAYMFDGRYLLPILCS